MRKPLKIAVLAGGSNAERDVSINSGKAVVSALTALGHTTKTFDVSPALAADLLAFAPDVVFNALHGRGGEDGTVQGLLDVLGFAYTHSGVKASAVAMDKKLTKKALVGTDVPLADDVVIASELLFKADPLPRPYVLKALDEGSSVSVRIVTDEDPQPLRADLDGPWNSYPVLMAERYVAGRELAVAVLNGEALGVIELRPGNGFYDYAAKYTDGVTEHIMPAALPDALTEDLKRYAAEAHTQLGCSGITRSDFRYDDRTGELAFLEINTQPGMTELSLVPEIAAWAGISFSALVATLVETALDQCENPVPKGGRP